MPTLTAIANILLSSRNTEIDRFRRYPIEVQREQFGFLIDKISQTTLGLDRGVGRDMSIEAFQQKIPVCDYEALSPHIDRCRRGEQGLLWPDPIRWYAKSSGTTDAKSKYIPITARGLKDMHMQGPRDVMAIYLAQHPESNILKGKMLTLGGSRKIEREGESVLSGDLSAILIDNTPIWATWMRVPSVETALTPDFDEKVRRICDEVVSENVTSFAGVPSWNLVLMNRILEHTGYSSLLELWPELELFIHGGMNFKPYRQEYKRIIPSDNMRYMETYNASEGFFGIGDDLSRDDMLLMLDYHVFYEFLAMDDLADHSKAVTLEGVITDVNYAMIITTSNGLWRYMIGDTVEFTSTDPYRIKITGRTKHFINAFGEELIIDNAETAMRKACDATGAEISEFTAAPIYMDCGEKGKHQWVVEFARMPDTIEHFTEVLDTALQQVNSDYEAKRFKNATLLQPLVSVVREGTFLEWMRMRGRLGGQNKVPRLYNDRTYIDQLLSDDIKIK